MLGDFWKDMDAINAFNIELKDLGYKAPDGKIISENFVMQDIVSRGLKILKK